MEVKFAIRTERDDRIFLLSYVNEKNEIEVYPLGSFPFEYFVYFGFKPLSVLTGTTYAPNTFMCSIADKDILKIVASATTSRLGTSGGFFFFESTVWNVSKTQKESKPVLYAVQTFNIFNNLRWVFFTKSQTNVLPSLTSIHPASCWSEREMQDMFLVKFKDIKDSRRLLLDYKTKRGILSPNQQVEKLPAYSSFFDIYYV